jgi:hypothetical protein
MSGAPAFSTILPNIRSRSSDFDKSAWLAMAVPPVVAISSSVCCTTMVRAVESDRCTFAGQSLRDRVPDGSKYWGRRPSLAAAPRWRSVA